MGTSYEMSFSLDAYNCEKSDGLLKKIYCNLLRRAYFDCGSILLFLESRKSVCIRQKEQNSSSGVDFEFIGLFDQ